jgi:glycerate dehydrogenase
MPNIVVLDGYTLNPGDLSWAGLETLGAVHVYERTPSHLLLERAEQAEIIVVNKQLVTEETLSKLPHLRFIAVSATGYNNVDTEAAAKCGIPVANVAGYSTPAVAQHVFALIMALTSRVNAHDQSVKAGDWFTCPDFSYTLGTIPELSTLTLGIYGFGRIGQAVAKVGLAHGMQILAHHKHPQRDAMDGVSFVSLPELFRQSNIVSLHAPLNDDNFEIVNRNLMSSMPKPGFLINTGRGGLVNEAELAACLQEDIITGAGLDVLQQEPPQKDNPLIGLANCIITPHVAWATQAARQRLMEEVILNIKAFLEGELRNRVS